MMHEQEPGQIFQGTFHLFLLFIQYMGNNVILDMISAMGNSTKI